MTSPRKPRPIRLTNTITGKKEDFIPIEPGRCRMYSCGPTVYGLIHIGNLRGGLVADMFYRYFQRAGYETTYVRNYTDVDDKIINRANEEKTTADAVARKYTQEVEKDYAVSGMLEPTHKTTVTTHMPEILAMIERIIANGKAYVVDGEVLFSIESFEGYGKLSHKKLDDLVAGIRVEVSDKKRNPLDFSLWKPAKPGEPFWDSPWGKGRPGWHIECSAMASKWLGSRIDVHHGGVDLVFPHHENEIAQSEGASGEAPFVHYWLHHAFVNMAKEKMSKSLGNVFTAREFLSKYSGEVARALLLSVHYRSPIEFSEEAIEQTLVSLERIYEAKGKAAGLLRRRGVLGQPRAEALWGGFVASCEKTRQEIDEAFANDFNAAEALASLFTLIREFNRVLAEPGAESSPQAYLGAEQLISVIEEDIGGILGFGRQEAEYALKDLGRIRAARPVEGGASRPAEDEILRLIQERLDARKAKDFGKADQIRKDLEARGVLLKDGPGGTAWSYK